MKLTPKEQENITRIEQAILNSVRTFKDLEAMQNWGSLVLLKIIYRLVGEAEDRDRMERIRKGYAEGHETQRQNGESCSFYQDGPARNHGDLPVNERRKDPRFNAGDPPGWGDTLEGLKRPTRPPEGFMRDLDPENGR